MVFCTNCARCAICKSHIAVLLVLVAIRKSQLAVHKKASKKLHAKNVDEIDPRWHHGGTRWHHGCVYLFCNFYQVNNHKIAYNSMTTKAKQKISTDLKSAQF
jgi:hypothetical protein